VITSRPSAETGATHPATDRLKYYRLGGVKDSQPLRPAAEAPRDNKVDTRQLKRLDPVTLRLGGSLTQIGTQKVGAAGRETHSAASAAPDVSGGAG
jgi:hypothetical protein